MKTAITNDNFSKSCTNLNISYYILYKSSLKYYNENQGLLPFVFLFVIMNHFTLFSLAIKSYLNLKYRKSQLITIIWVFYYRFEIFIKNNVCYQGFSALFETVISVQLSLLFL